MSNYRLIWFLVFAIQLGVFGKLVLLHLNPNSPVATWSWWVIALPLYGPFLIAIFLLLFSYVLDRLYLTVFPTSDGNHYKSFEA